MSAAAEGEKVANHEKSLRTSSEKLPCTLQGRIYGPSDILFSKEDMDVIMSVTGYISKLQEYELHALQLVIIYHHIPNHSHLQSFLIFFDSYIEELNIFQ